jgi:hypothetical protein
MIRTRFRMWVKRLLPQDAMPSGSSTAPGCKVDDDGRESLRLLGSGPRNICCRSGATNLVRPLHVSIEPDETHPAPDRAESHAAWNNQA